MFARMNMNLLLETARNQTAARSAGGWIFPSAMKFLEDWKEKTTPVAAGVDNKKIIVHVNFTLFS